MARGPRGSHQRSIGQGPAVRGGRRRTPELPDNVREALTTARKAHRDEAFGAAAEQFDALATRAGEVERHRFALHTALRAADDHQRGGNAEAAAASITAGVTHAAAMTDREVALRKLSRGVYLLTEAGHTTLADALKGQGAEALGLQKLAPFTPSEVNRTRRRALPKACPTCKARLKPATMVFGDSRTECMGCGTELS
jgi:cation transport regulator ChaB